MRNVRKNPECQRNIIFGLVLTVFSAAPSLPLDFLLSLYFPFTSECFFSSPLFHQPALAGGITEQKRSLSHVCIALLLLAFPGQYLHLPRIPLCRQLGQNVAPFPVTDVSIRFMPGSWRGGRRELLFYFFFALQLIQMLPGQYKANFFILCLILEDQVLLTTYVLIRGKADVEFQISKY